MATKLQFWNLAASAAGETQTIQSEQDTSLAAVLLALNFDHKLKQMLELRPWRFARMQAPLVEVSEIAVPYTGDGVTVEYPVPYDNGDASHLAVTVGGVASELGVGWTYTAPTNGYDGIVTFVAAPAAAAAIVITVSTKRNGWAHVYALPANFISPVALLIEDDRIDMLIDPRERIAYAIMPNNSGNGMILCTDEEDFETLEYTGVPTQMTMLPAHFGEALVCLLAAMLIKAIPKDMARARAMMDDYRVALNDAVMVDNANAGQPEYRESAALACR